MTRPARLIAFSGSLRQGSFNHKLVSVAADMARSAGAEVTTLRLADYPMPLFSEDLEKAEGPNAAVRDLRRLFAECDGILVASPEYNGSVTAALKNTLDWLSRPIKDSDVGPAFQGKVVGLLATSPGPLGGLRGLNHAKDVFYNLGALVLPSPVAVPSAFNALDEAGQLTDERVAGRVDNLVQRVVATASGLAG